jgi:hypothetical protein
MTTCRTRGFILFSLMLAGLLAAGCAEVTRPQVAAPEQEAAQLAAARRHPHDTWTKERTSRVFLKLLACLPQVHGRTYPFLGFDWWVTATGKVAVDHVWYPSPAHDVGLKQGDLILAVNNWPLPTWVAGWDQGIRTSRDILHDLFLTNPPKRTNRRRRSQNPSQEFLIPFLPGEILSAIMLDMKHIGLEAQGRYLTGPVDLLVQREEKKFTLTIYPQHLPAEYGLEISSQDRKINAYAGRGEIILTHRLVNFCLNDDELALIVGHELAHQAQGHLVRSSGHQQLGRLLGETMTAFATLSLNRILGWRQYLVDADVRRVSKEAVVSVFSRDDEREADIYGAWYAFQAGYNVDKGLAVWERVAAVDEKDPFLSTYFLESHPAPLERLAALKKVAKYFQAGQAAEVFLQAGDLNLKPAPR